MDNYFAELYAVNVNDKVEQKNGLTYLAWAYAWAEIKKRHPDAYYTIYENPQGWNYHTDGRTCWVKTGVTVNGLEHIEYLPVMDVRNRSIPAESVTSTDVNKAIQRSLTKAAARHGLGLYIYAGEDLPEEEKAKAEEEKAAADNAPASEAYLASIRHLVEEKGWNMDGCVEYCARKWGRASLDQLTMHEAALLIQMLNAKKDKKGAGK